MLRGVLIFKRPAGIYLPFKRNPVPGKSDSCISLFVAFDPGYNNTRREDYDNLSEEEKGFFHTCMFIGPEDVQAEKEFLVKQQIMDQECAEKCFGNGYAVQRNIILYEALKQKVDYLIF